MSSKINLQTCEYARKSSIFQDNQLIFEENSVIITALLNENGSHKYEFVGTEWLNPQGDSVTHLSARGA